MAARMRTSRDRNHPSAIAVPDRLREIREETVTRLIDSITRIGLLTPISVRWAKDAGGADDLILVAGRHRLVL
jgi:ParB-like chromosome segregation protein Spo0J